MLWLLQQNLPWVLASGAFGFVFTAFLLVSRETVVDKTAPVSQAVELEEPAALVTPWEVAARLAAQAERRTPVAVAAGAAPSLPVAQPEPVAAVPSARRKLFGRKPAEEAGAAPGTPAALAGGAGSVFPVVTEPAPGLPAALRGDAPSQAEPFPAPVPAGPMVAGPTVAGPTVAGPTVAGPTVAGPTVAEPTVAAPTVGELALEEERKRLDEERAELERERLQHERDELEAERRRVEAERERRRAEAERKAAEREEQERLASERAEAERAAAEAARLEAERAEAERVAVAQAEAARLEAERLESERRAAEEAEAERAAEAARLEAERLEAARLNAERIAAEQAEAERLLDASDAVAEEAELHVQATELLDATLKPQGDRPDTGDQPVGSDGHGQGLFRRKRAKEIEYDLEPVMLAVAEPVEAEPIPVEQVAEPEPTREQEVDIFAAYTVTARPVIESVQRTTVIEEAAPDEEDLAASYEIDWSVTPSYDPESHMPFGPGSLAPRLDGMAPAGHPIKGNLDTMLFHTTSSRWFNRIKADVWFETEQLAQRAGFTRWDQRGTAATAMHERRL